MVVGKFGFYTAGPNTALVTSSGKIAIAGRLFALPIIHRVDSLSLKLRTITVHTNHGTTVNGVAVHVTGCCQVKIHGWSTVPGPHGEEMAIDHDAIRLAAQHFLGHSDAHIADAIQKTVEGHQRAIIGTLTIEQLYSDRSAFSHQVKELCVQDMRNMGLSMVSYTVAEISDDEGYINALGTTQTEKVKRAATEGFAMHRSNALAKSREMEAHSHLKINQQRELMIQSHKELQIHRASAQTTINQAEANQQKAYAIEIAKENAVLHVAKRDAEAAKAEAERVVEAINVQKAKLHNEIRKNIPANAALYRKEREAEAIRAKSAADADRLRMISEAQAYSIRLKGAAKTKALEERVRMWNEW